LGRIDAGIRAVKSAAAKIRAAGVAIPATSEIPDADVRPVALTEDGEKLAAHLLESLAGVEQKRHEVTPGEGLIGTRRREIVGAGGARKLELEKNIKSGIRFLALFFAILFLKWCASLFK